MLACLRHDTFVGGYDEQDDVDSVSAREHILDESFVSGNVDESECGIPAGEISESDVDRNPAFLLFLESIRIDAGKGLDQRGLSMIHVAGRAYDDSFHSALCANRFDVFSGVNWELLTCHSKPFKLL